MLYPFEVYVGAKQWEIALYLSYHDICESFYLKKNGMPRINLPVLENSIFMQISFL